MAPRLAYVVRFVGTLGPAVDFYAGVLGLTLTKRAEHWAQFDCGSVRLRLYERAGMATLPRGEEGAPGSRPRRRGARLGGGGRGRRPRRRRRRGGAQLPVAGRPLLGRAHRLPA